MAQLTETESVLILDSLRKHVIANENCDYGKVEKVKRLKIT